MGFYKRLEHFDSISIQPYQNGIQLGPTTLRRRRHRHCDNHHRIRYNHRRQCFWNYLKAWENERNIRCNIECNIHPKCCIRFPYLYNIWCNIRSNIKTMQ